jgi:hypothetical protein
VGYDGRGCRVDSTDTREGQKWRISPKEWVDSSYSLVNCHLIQKIANFRK